MEDVDSSTDTEADVGAEWTGSHNGYGSAVSRSVLPR